MTISSKSPSPLSVFYWGGQLNDGEVNAPSLSHSLSGTRSLEVISRGSLNRTVLGERKFLQDGLVHPLSREVAEFAKDLTVIFFEGERQVGQGVFVASGGKVLTSGEVAFDSAGNPRQKLVGHLSDGRRYSARVVGFDPVTDLALVMLLDLQPGMTTRQANLSSRDPKGVVLVVLPNGPERGEVSRTGVPGVLGPLSRFASLNEFRFERGPGSVAGAPVFSAEGELVGLLMAALSVPTKGMGMEAFAETVGPRNAVTTYSLSVLVLRRVISGLTSPSGHVQHPWVGVFVRGTSSGQTVITQVVSSSPAAIAGLLPGDRIVMAGGNPVRSPVDFVRYLSELSVGSIADLVIERGAMQKKVALAVVADPISKVTVLRRSPRGSGDPLAGF